MRLWEVLNEDISRPNLNDAFWAWFGKSKAVDRNGQPLMLYHGRIGDFDTFDPEIGNSKRYCGGSMNAHFFTDHPDNASGYAGRRTGDFTVSYAAGGNVMPVYLRMVKPLKVNAQKNNWDEIPYKGNYYYIPDLVEIAKATGYDSLIVSNVYDWRDGTNTVPCTTYVVFSPSQIKSVFNRGTWGPTSNIMETQLRDHNQLLVDYLVNCSDVPESWSDFVEWAVYQDGVVSEIEDVAGLSLSAESYEEEIDNLMELDPRIYGQLPEWIRLEFNTGGSSSTNSRQTLSLLRDTLLPNDTVLIHYTNDPMGIMRNGFQRGVRDISRLGETVRTPHLSAQPGYNFAYLPQHTPAYQSGAWKKSHAVIFRSRGVLISHHGDREPQVVFWGPYVNPRDIITSVPADEVSEYFMNGENDAHQ